MAKVKNCSISFGERLTAYDAPEHMDDLSTFVKEMEEGATAEVDASAITNIDTAGCQFIDLALTVARKKAEGGIKLEVKLSEAVRQAFETLGLNPEEEADEPS